MKNAYFRVGYFDIVSMIYSKVFFYYNKADSLIFLTSKYELIYQY